MEPVRSSANRLGESERGGESVEAIKRGLPEEEKEKQK